MYFFPNSIIGILESDMCNLKYKILTELKVLNTNILENKNDIYLPEKVSITAKL